MKKKGRIFNFNARPTRSGQAGRKLKNMQNILKYLKYAEYHSLHKCVYVAFGLLCSQPHLWFYVQVYAIVMPWTCLVC
jgi:hypothetical protein